LRGSLPCAISSAVRWHDAVDAHLADEEVVRLLGEHEAGGPRQRVEAALRQRGELVLASRSVNIANMKKLSQSSIGSLKAFKMRGLSDEPLRRAEQLLGLLAPSRPKWRWSR